MLKTTGILFGLVALTACTSYHPYNRLSNGGHLDCVKLKKELNMPYRVHTPGSTLRTSSGPGLRASEMHLYEQNCEDN